MQEAATNFLEKALSWRFTCPVIAIVPAVVLFALGRAIIERKKFHVSEVGIVLITGASTGIGRHAAEHMAKKHKDLVILAGVRKESDAENIRQMKIPNLIPIIVDVNKAESCTRCLEQVIALSQSRQIPFVGLVNNAGVARNIPVEYHPIDDAKKLFDTNVFGVFHMTQLFLPLLRASKGRIVTLSSIAGLVGAPLRAVYCASKFAVEGYMDSLRRELLGSPIYSKISISLVEPGMVSTEIFKSAIAAMKEEIEAITNDKEKKELYLHLYNDDAVNLRKRGVELAHSPQCTSDAIDHALTSAYPRTRYVVAGVGAVPGWVLGWLIWSMPDRLKDWVTTQF
jgi:short-subunit dehydrogenase